MLQKTGLADSLMSQFDTIEILDDMMDHWGAKHKQEKVDVIHMFQARVHGLLSMFVNLSSFGPVG